MCGIIGAIAERNIARILVEGLRRLEYRGYDSAGVALINEKGELACEKDIGKIGDIEQQHQLSELQGTIGIAHTRWATHGKPSAINAHPHTSGPIAVVLNGIVENHDRLRTELKTQGYTFVSETDAEVIPHLIHHEMKTETDLLSAVHSVMERLEGSYAIAVVSSDHPNSIVVARRGSPLIIGYGIGEMYVASDSLALRQVTDTFSYLEEGDIARLTLEQVEFFDAALSPVTRERLLSSGTDDEASLGKYRHFMEKEIFEQAEVIRQTLEGRVGSDHVVPEAFGSLAKGIFERVRGVHIVACGTSYHAGLVARAWLEEWAQVPVTVEIASEYRYKTVLVHGDRLFVSISQSGETADTLAALRKAKTLPYLAHLSICNVPSSSLVRESDFSLMTNVGREIGVASTKAFTSQLVALQLLAICVGRAKGLDAEKEKELVLALLDLPKHIEQVLKLNKIVERTFDPFASLEHAIFLGRGVHYPVAMEGALKLKEVSYIHAEAYAAGELKHGPLALVDEHVPVVAIAPNNELLDKLKSNLHEVKARGGVLYVFASTESNFSPEPGIKLVELPASPASLTPILYAIPLQLLAYHVALMKGTDVDKPRNLAKSVTVE